MMRTKWKSSARAQAGLVSIIAIGSWLALSPAGLAQTPPQPAPPGPPEVADPPSETTSPPADPSTGGGEPTEPLTKRLEQGEGVLEPPRGIDPKIEKKVPSDVESKTPVIPPPGEPGGRQDVQPK